MNKTNLITASLFAALLSGLSVSALADTTATTPAPSAGNAAQVQAPMQVTSNKEVHKVRKAEHKATKKAGESVKANKSDAEAKIGKSEGKAGKLEAKANKTENKAVKSEAKTGSQQKTDAAPAKP